MGRAGQEVALFIALDNWNSGSHIQQQAFRPRPHSPVLLQAWRLVAFPVSALCVARATCPGDLWCISAPYRSGQSYSRSILKRYILFPRRPKCRYRLLDHHAEDICMWVCDCAGARPSAADPAQARRAVRREPGWSDKGTGPSGRRHGSFPRLAELPGGEAGDGSVSPRYVDALLMLDHHVVMC